MAYPGRLSSITSEQDGYSAAEDFSRNVVITQPKSAGEAWGNNTLIKGSGFQSELRAAQERQPAIPVGGLQEFANYTHLFIKQRLDLVEGCDRKNIYEIKNPALEKIGEAREESECRDRCFCGPLRPFYMEVKDNESTPILSINRPLACDNCLCPCCLQTLEIFSPPGHLVGRIEQEHSCCPKFLIKNSDDEVVMRIDMPCCQVGMFCCADVEFPISSADGSTSVGLITKQWGGCLVEAFSVADSFQLSFFTDVEPEMKAVLIGAVFLVDFVMFERQKRNYRFDAG